MTIIVTGGAGLMSLFPKLFESAPKRGKNGSKTAKTADFDYFLR